MQTRPTAPLEEFQDAASHTSRNTVVAAQNVDFKHTLIQGHYEVYKIKIVKRT